MRKFFIGLGALVGALLILILAYAAYVLLSMGRIADNQDRKASCRERV